MQNPRSLLPAARGVAARRVAARCLAAAAVALPAVLTNALPTPAAAQRPTQQAGRVAGRVTDEARNPLVGAQVSVVGTRFGASTASDGTYRIAGVPAGTYDVRVVRLGQKSRTVAGVVVRAGEDATVDVALADAPAALGGVVVSASRRVEKVTDAPATITRIEASTIESTAGNSFGPALKMVKGIDFVQVGMASVGVNARGFNSSFNNRMLMMEDNRIATLAESGLPLGNLSTVPKVDLASVEVLVGPGSALYGPDASNGVITLQTKDPREYKGTTAEVTGGNRSFMDAQLRHAGVAGNLGYKVTGEYLSTNDWSNQNFYAPVASGGPAVPEVGADFKNTIVRGGGSLVYYTEQSGRLELSAGATNLNGIGYTNLGRNQLEGYGYKQAQLRYSRPGWFAQVYHTRSNGGDTYQLNGFAQNRVRYPSITEDSVRKLSAFPGEGRLTAGELQNSFAVSALNDLRVTWGGQIRQDQVTSDRQWLIDRKTGEDIKVMQKGVYAQLEQPVTSWLRAVVAGRYDKHDYYDAQFSPKAAILVTPVEDQTFRVTYNRAFKSPTILQTSFWFPDFQPAVGVFGNRNGYVIKNAAGTVVNSIDAIRPEVNNTWEVGYKGIIKQRLYLDVAGFYSDFDHFMSPLLIIANFATPAAQGGPTFAFDAKTGEQLKGATGGPQIPLTYINVGRAKIHGADMGLRWMVTPTVSVSGTASLQKLDQVIRKPTDPAEATAFNSPSTKFNVGADATQLGSPNAYGGFTVRYVNGYGFLSGVNIGKVPTFGTFDFNTGYKLGDSGVRLNLNVQNLLACRGGTTAPNGYIGSGRASVYTAGQKCGFNVKHIEMVNTPQIGTMVFLGLRVER